MKDLQGTDQLGESFSEEYDELDRLLAAYCIPVREGFAELVMEALPEVAHSHRKVGLWAAAIALLIGFAGGGAWLLGTGGSASAVGSVAAIADLFVTALLAGAGLLSASWSGLSTTLKTAASDSPSFLLVLGFAATTLGFVLFRLLRRRRALQTVVSEDRRDER